MSFEVVLNWRDIQHEIRISLKSNLGCLAVCTKLEWIGLILYWASASPLIILYIDKMLLYKFNDWWLNWFSSQINEIESLMKAVEWKEFSSLFKCWIEWSGKGICVGKIGF